MLLSAFPLRPICSSSPLSLHDSSASRGSRPVCAAFVSSYGGWRLGRRMDGWGRVGISMEAF